MKRVLAALVCLVMTLCCATGALAYVYERDYFVNDQHAQIKEIQARLIELEYLPSGADGWFGKKTKAAILRFQAVNDLEETGIADVALQDALFSRDAKRSPVILMSLDALKDMMGAPTMLARYDMSEMVVGKHTASVELNNDVTLDAELIGSDVVSFALVGKGNVKIPFTVLLMMLDKSISTADVYGALDTMIAEKERSVNGKLIRYTKDDDDTEHLIVTPFGSGTVE